MARYHNPNIVLSNLLLNLDFKNSKRFTTTLGAGNLVQNFSYNASTWGSYYPANTTLTTGIDAPDGSNTAVRISCRTTGNSLLRVTFTAFTPNGTDTYATSFWVRKISGTTSSSNQLTTDLNDVNPSANYVSSLVTDKWVRIVATGVPTATSKSFIDLLSDNANDYVLDFWGVKVENITAANNEYPTKDTLSGYTFNNYRPQYTTLDGDSVTFTRTTAPTSKHGGIAYTTGTGSLTSGSFLYGNHTWEIWFKINDRYPEGSSTEGYSILSVYRGYHSGFYYDATNMYYGMWDNTGPTSFNACSWTVGASGAQINQGSWHQIVVSRSGNVYTPYVNGAQVGTGSTRASTALAGVSSDIHLGAAANLGAGAGSYVYYSKNSIANMKMYNRALTAAEIAQNFQALRGRFGI